MGATIVCPHGGLATVQAAQTRVTVSGSAVARAADTYPVTGCPLNINGKPQPCVTIQWPGPATRVTVNGNPVVLATSTGLCRSAEQAPQGPPTVPAVQPRVVAQ
ncbi:hypothetical protein [Nucisporomicrobium flavum]|uniref:hypothetical protein n=1 Tax=Nucisporomicrobium flavum TaxID=2785915 RepID=UPI0018F60E28|nr:hypothetical protein [Nucisporomicrobium flavum]